MLRSLFVLLALLALDLRALAQQPDIAVRSPVGNLVRIVGPVVDPGAQTSPTELGDVLVLAKVPTTAICNVVLLAEPIDRAKAYGDPGLTGEIPDLPDLYAAFADRRLSASEPVRLADTCEPGLGCFWNVLFRGQACLAAADSTGYVLSSMAELLPLGPGPMSAWKCRLLRASVVIDSEDGDARVTVSACDPRVTPGSPMWVSHSWAGRTSDLGYRELKDGAVQPRSAQKKAGSIAP